MSVLSNGYLLALVAGGIDFDLEFLVIAGGGDGNRPGGGAGGYISSVSGESSGGGASALSAVGLTTGETYSVTVGASGSNSSFSGTDTGATAFNHVATAGGAGTGNNAGGNGGSGGGGDLGESPKSGGSGTSNQGYDGAGGALIAWYCTEPWGVSLAACSSQFAGGGGGAGGAGSGSSGGVGVQSSITGTATYYAGGGGGANTAGSRGSGGTGYTNYGGGGHGSSGQNGAVIVRYPDTVTLSNPGGGLTFSTSTVGANKVTSITGGTGNIEFG